MTLDKLARLYKEKGSYANAHIDNLSNEFNVDIYGLINNLQVLEYLGFVDSVTSGSFKITHEGLDSVNLWKTQVGFAEVFRQISELNPQARGREFQKFFAKIIEYYGWSIEEGARTSHEEIDVLIHKEREYYLVECKWLKDPIEAPVVRELYGKLSNRSGVHGILASMSGFSQGAIEQGEKYASDRVILFFGTEDIRKLIYGLKLFDLLLDEKYQEFITRGKIIYS